MKRNPTAPSVITDVNGKVTTVHRKVSGAGDGGSGLSAVQPARPEPTMIEVRDLFLSVNSKAGELKVSGSYGVQMQNMAKAAAGRRDLELLRVLGRLGDGHRDLQSIEYAVRYVEENFEPTPDEFLTIERADAVDRISKAALVWEEKFTPDKWRDEENYQSMLSAVLNDPQMEKVIVYALERGVGDMRDIEKLAGEFNATHSAVTEGML